MVSTSFDLRFRIILRWLPGTIEYPRRSYDINIKTDKTLPVPDGQDAYTMVLRHLQHVWGGIVQLVPDTAPNNMGEPFTRKSVCAYDYVTFNGLRYGSDLKHNGRKYRHAYTNGRDPLRIAIILHIKHERANRQLPALEHTCAIIQRFVQDPRTPNMPWDLQCVSAS